MKTTPRIRGQIADITGQGARIRLDDGRDGFVSTTDYFWSEWIVNGRIGEGDSLYFDVLGMLPDGRGSLGFEPVGEKSSRLVGVDQQWVTSLEEVRGECPDEVAAVERHRLFLVGPTQRRSMRRICFRSLPEVHEFISRDLKNWRQGH